ncbi:hypothetical protein VNI00_005223 [Paramarasmius palmivorus]|uniref:Uncharacterized protein n=1 Tax=Paramarasmius palmivorus TaxID=297713 RepID=A0AAW0DES9_9AGAR
MAPFGDTGSGSLFDLRNDLSIHRLRLLSTGAFFDESQQKALMNLIRDHFVFVRGFYRQHNRNQSRLNALNRCFNGGSIVGKNTASSDGVYRPSYLTQQESIKSANCDIFDILESVDTSYVVRLPHSGCGIVDAIAKPLSTELFCSTHLDAQKVSGPSNRPWFRCSTEWHLVASSNVSYDAGIAPSGLNAEFYLVRGAVLLFLCDTEGSAVSTDLDCSSGKERCIPEFNTVRGLLLLEGDRLIVRPGTTCFIVTLESSVLCATYFYSATNLDCSFRTHLHTFFRPELLGRSVSPDCFQSWYAILLFWHGVYADNIDEYLTGRLGYTESLHVPDVTDIAGLFQVFSLLAMVSLGKTLHGSRYGGSLSGDAVELHRLSMEVSEGILRALDRTLVLCGESGEVLACVDDLWESFIVAQCLVMLRTCVGASHPDRNYEQVTSYLRQDLRRSESRMEAIGSMWKGGTYVFGENLDFSVTVSDCLTMDWVSRLSLSVPDSGRLLLRRKLASEGASTNWSATREIRAKKRRREDR